MDAINSIVSNIREDKILKWLLLGIFSPILILILMLLAFALRIDLPNSSGLFSILIYIFTISLFSIVIYIPFIKKSERTKDTKLIISLWITVSIIILGIWERISSFPVSINKPQDDIFLLVPISLVLIGVGIPFFIINFILNRLDEKSRKIILKSIVFSLFFSSFLALTVYYLKPLKTQIFYPYTFQHYGSDYACEGLVVTSTSTDDGKIDPSKKGIYAEISTSSKQLDKLAISIKDNELEFTTSADVETGSTKGRPLNIIENSDNYLVAADRDTTGLAKPYGVFIMNKKTGMALWNQSLMRGFPSDDPLSDVEYFVCR